MIGMDADQEAVRRELDRALVTSKEFELGPEAWVRWELPCKDGKSVFVEVENLQPVHMMQIDLDLETDEGEEIVTKIWNTIHVAK